VADREGNVYARAVHVLAYLDPGTGSMLVQLIVGGVAAAAVGVKLFWYRILRFLRIRRDEPGMTGAKPDHDG
jgi:hypothetical protein